MTDHEHVMAPDEVGDSWYQCQFCDFGLFDFEMPIESVSGWAEKVADRPLMDWQREFLDNSIRWRNPVMPNRRGKRAAYEEMVRTLEETIGPSQPLVGRDGKEHGRFWDESFTARGGQ